MKVIIGIETINVPGHGYEYGHGFRKPGIIPCRPGDRPIEEDSYKREFIQGRRFVDGKGNILVIGMTSEVRKTLGIPFDAIENMGAEIERYQAERVRFIAHINRYQTCISKLGRTGFLKRLKFLFTGITIEEEPRDLAGVDTWI